LPEQGERRRTVRAQHFIERQLPLITQRLQLALDKLQSPGKISAEQRPLRDWYEALVARNQNTGTTFHAEIMRDPLIPTDLFDSVVENLLENARFKRQVAPGVEIRVDVYSDDNDLTVRVTDTGARVPEEAVPNLFKRPVSSHAGLGVGLFQSARQADALGYALSLQNNEKGCVTFELRRRPDLSATDQYSLFTTG
jgi:signal transduction histidine kinase